MDRILPQGSELFALVPKEDAPTEFEVIKVDCAISVDFGEDERDDLEDTCLEERDNHTTIPGLNTPGESAVTVRINPQNPGHVRLYQLSDTGERLLWALGWSDGTAPAAPKSGSTMEFELPTTRTWNVFQGHIKRFNFAGFEVGGEPIQGAITIKRATKPVWVVKVPTP
ncbi:hypothetical protein F3J24_17190 [Comamonas sp. Tr-654]|uniref:phage tail tube protein n=1 Tax=Comamonas sp. Tr-654 TaxID=2608341 RepID=UPI001423C00D|nr:phage tail tube protein [Comamonas sp. Tr-654]NIF85249.1 hypothetical protein [Comamonas sp. Tr-654]